MPSKDEAHTTYICQHTHKSIHPSTQIITKELFELYPPDQPSIDEHEQLQAARAALRRQAKRSREPTTMIDQRKSNGGTARNTIPDSTTATITRKNTMHNALGESSTTGDRRSSHGAAAHTAANTTNTTSTTTTTTKGRVAKEYVPGIGTANYAFLICLLKAQEGPEKKEFLGKDDLMKRAESSGLADKPIFGSTEPIPPTFNPRDGNGQYARRNFFNGWSGFKTMVAKQLVWQTGVPMRIALCNSGKALAERLYRDAVMRGKMDAIPGIPIDGPMRFQGEGSGGHGGGGHGNQQRRASLLISSHGQEKKGRTPPSMVYCTDGVAPTDQTFAKTSMTTPRTVTGRAFTSNSNAPPTDQRGRPSVMHGREGPSSLDAATASPFEGSLIQRLKRRGMFASSPSLVQQSDRRKSVPSIPGDVKIQDTLDRDHSKKGYPPPRQNITAVPLETNTNKGDQNDDVQIIIDLADGGGTDRNMNDHVTPHSTVDAIHRDECLAHMVDMGFSDKKARKESVWTFHVYIATY